MKYILLQLSIILPFLSVAQPAPMASPSHGTVKGKVLDAETRQPVEYANVAIYSYGDSSLVTGGISDSNGNFSIPKISNGKYYATIKFLGYDEYKKENITITGAEKQADLGIVELHPSSQNLSQLEVVADKRQIIYKIDRKVINPSQFIASQGGSAVDILQNTPSVQVDIEGNVTMRGSSSFMVLVNGRPTPFEPSDALAQIPASTIENIEIITNPSAKYDPDGASGIINIITKKTGKRGWNGVVNANASTLGAYGGDFLFNFTGDKANYYIGANRNDRVRKADYTTENGNIIDQDTFFIGQNGNRDMRFQANSIKAGFDLNLNEKNILGLQLNGGQRSRNFDNGLTNLEWQNSEIPEITYSNGVTEADAWFVSANLNHKVKFGDSNSQKMEDEHKLESSINYQYEDGDDGSSNLKWDANDVVIDRQRSWERETEKELRIKTDYTLPFENGRFEAGYQLRLDDEWSNYDAEFQDTVGDFYNESTYYRLINSLYATYSGKLNRFGYQLGLRAEHTLRQMDVVQLDSLFEINRLDWYPTLHLSYDLRSEQQIMASYSRRIERPRGWYLDPFITWRDPNNVRQGNPGLNPEYVNALEVSYIKTFGENSLTVELFHRNTYNKIERIRSSFGPNILLTSFENVGQDFSSGIEVMLDYNITKWWRLNLSGSLYDYRLDVTPAFESTINETRSNNYNIRFSNTFKPAANTRIQFDGNYNSPSVQAQGTRSAFAFTSLAVKQSLFKRKMDVSVSVFDLFDTARFKAETTGDDFFSNYEFNMKSPFVTFTLSYKFNNYKPERPQNGQGGGGGMDMEQ